jgi:hypothetical protein
MAKKLRRNTTLISRTQHELANVEIIRLALEDLLREMPGTQFIEISASEFYDDEAPVEALPEWALPVHCPRNEAE